MQHNKLIVLARAQLRPAGAMYEDVAFVLLDAGLNATTDVHEVVPLSRSSYVLEQQRRSSTQPLCCLAELSY